ncbi:surface-adhesin E family protein [Novacetimonas pomaceti]|uniref:surface-adhesin E family protein n=1 Tax=Novacetimonas pomaceti TaxID=2021998 RepID=UPI001EF134DE|nr:surface-adhesin E family protein [Novacetimonas pomaceti]
MNDRLALGMVSILGMVSVLMVPTVPAIAAGTPSAVSAVPVSVETAAPAAPRAGNAEPPPNLQKLPPYQNKVTEYIDRSSVRMRGTHASATFVQDFDDEMISHGLPFASVRFSVLYNCAANTYRTLSYSTWSGHMGRGRRLADGPVPRGEMTVDPSLEDGRRIACGP